MFATFDFDIPISLTVFADKSYNLYWLEDVLNEAGIRLLPISYEELKAHSAVMDDLPNNTFIAKRQ